MNKKDIIKSALYDISLKSKKDFLKDFIRIVASSSQLVAWDFPPRNYKKAYLSIKEFLHKKGIEVKPTVADWPHFSIAYIPPPDADQKHKIKLAGPLCSTKVKTDDIIVLKGSSTPYAYICWHLKVENESKVLKFIKFIDELMDTTQKFSFKPHVSLAIVDADKYDELEKLLPDLQKIVKPFSVSYSPEQIQIWDKMTIYEIDTMEFK